MPVTLCLEPSLTCKCKSVAGTQSQTHGSRLPVIGNHPFRRRQPQSICRTRTEFPDSSATKIPELHPPSDARCQLESPRGADDPTSTAASSGSPAANCIHTRAPSRLGWTSPAVFISRDSNCDARSGADLVRVTQIKQPFQHFATLCGADPNSG